MKIIKYSRTEKVAKYSTNLLTGKLNLKETLLVKFMIRILINGQYQQRTWRFFALATADFYTDTRQCRHLDKVKWDKYCTTLPVLVWDERQKLQGQIIYI